MFSAIFRNICKKKKEKINFIFSTLQFLPLEAAALAQVFGWPSGNSLSAVVGVDTQLEHERKR